MINEEKASELAEVYCKHYALKDIPEEDLDLFSSYPECKKVAMLMAEWKDEQYQEYLKEKIEILQLKNSKIQNRMSFAAGHAEDKLSMAKEIYHDLFECGIEMRAEIIKEDEELQEEFNRIKQSVCEYNAKINQLRQKLINNCMTKDDIQSTEILNF